MKRKSESTWIRGGEGRGEGERRGIGEEEREEVGKEEEQEEEKNRADERIDTAFIEQSFYENEEIRRKLCLQILFPPL